MRRTIALTAGLLLTGALMTGCGVFKKSPDAAAVEYHFEVTGAGTGKISYSIPQYSGKEGDPIRPVTGGEPSATLPWKASGVAYPGKVTLEVTPSTGVATCRIRFAKDNDSEKKEVAKQQGQPGAPVTCTATVKS